MTLNAINNRSGRRFSESCTDDTASCSMELFHADGFAQGV
jgi:hypothetical protein